jgi:hypothetical protein
MMIMMKRAAPIVMEPASVSSRGGLCAVIFSCMLLAGCSEVSQQKQLVADKKSFVTIAASIEMTLQQWLGGALPNQFVSRALTDGGKALGFQTGQVTIDMVGAKKDDTSLRQTMSAATSAVIAAQVNVEQSDQTGGASALQDLQEAIASLRAADTL